MFSGQPVSFLEDEDEEDKLSSSMIVVAAVVAFGMVGSQLDLGGLVDKPLVVSPLAAVAMPTMMKTSGPSSTAKVISSTSGEVAKLLQAKSATHRMTRM